MQVADYRKQCVALTVNKMYLVNYRYTLKSRYSIIQLWFFNLCTPYVCLHNHRRKRT